MIQWIKNLFAEKKLIARIPMRLHYTFECGETEVLIYFVYCYMQGTKRKFKVFGNSFKKGYVKKNHSIMNKIVRPWIKFGADDILKQFCQEHGFYCSL